MHKSLHGTLKSVMRGQKIYQGEFGVELEYEGKGFPETPSPWVGKAEGSLRGEALEYVLETPMTKEGVGKSLDRLFERFENQGTEIKLTPRASTHIHMNMQHDRLQDILNTILVFTVVEPMVLRLCGQKRNGNLFCMSSYETGDLPVFFRRMQKCMIQNYWDEPPLRGKYASINSDALFKYGSLEFRCFPNTVDKAEILKWISWLQNVKTISLEQKDKTLDKFLEYGYNNPEELTRKLLGYLPSLGDINSNIHNLIHLGIETAYEAREPLLELYSSEAKEEPKPKLKIRKPSFGSDTAAITAGWNVNPSQFTQPVYDAISTYIENVTEVTVFNDPDGDF